MCWDSFVFFDDYLTSIRDQILGTSFFQIVQLMMGWVKAGERVALGYCHFVSSLDCVIKPQLGSSQQGVLEEAVHIPV